ncbi:MAG: NADH-quinone oxidoreductase subunit I [Candidatus Heimdallarchaeum endolithica]|uniref:NADH-quinone oxidoreductase subunit I n=1 Tax=Candidatus Heimdallarchaeum endolithica TaxID=2876572 RepID=A0A9Y1BRX3_9ARCH|nr:MAG: NADH-quinone oxidoreductase subunit I [Candidatus Heimdallarchaeum endolithica]
MKLSVISEIFKNLFKRPMTVLFPMEKVEIPERERAKHKFDIDNCISCGSCAKICLNKAIKMVEVKKEYKEKYPKTYPQIDLGKCCFCALCQDICPTGCLILTEDFYLATFDKDSIIIEPLKI